MKQILKEHHDLHTVDIIGDVHGCYQELQELLFLLGYRNSVHPEGRIPVFVGDLADRGPWSANVISFVLWAIQTFGWEMVLGNHDAKLLSFWHGNPVTDAHGFGQTKEDIELLDDQHSASIIHDPPKTVKGKCLETLEQVPLALSLDNGNLIVVHGGYHKSLHQPDLKYKDAKWIAAYGMPDGSVDVHGYPKRRDWANSYDGKAFVVFGHTPHPLVEWYPMAINIDTGCCFGGALTALRWPELEVVQIKSKQPILEERWHKCQ